MSAQQYRQLSAAIGKIHEAALAPEAWPKALAAISHCFDEPKVCMFGLDLCHGTVHDLRTHDIDAQACDDYAEGPSATR